MKTSRRFDNAVSKLYAAFQNEVLNPECCKQCAVGNILNNSDSWKHFSDAHGSTQLNYVGKVNEAFGKRFGGYLPSEILEIEKAFLAGCGYELPFRRSSSYSAKLRSKDRLFEGLSAAVSCLCKLDRINDVMDCSQLFKYVPENSRERNSINLVEKKRVFALT